MVAFADQADHIATSIAIDADVSSLVTAAVQIAPDIDNARSDAANEMAVGNDLTALGYAGAPRTRARCHANGHATVMGGPCRAMRYLAV
ncbi:hypothetical protein FHT08_002771 [Xanthomonas campestris]|uniref:hypothetical protein n=1 Tax=Xanthomonas sp. CFBP 8151 TaxID=3035310 RepID=UPI00141B68B2|nr:hypothetical protein [Xanthomonas sp. CFBP 8151]NIJ77688.1 hypothetical protein [Xanthomonas sp. CFBP 8151]